MSRDRSQALPSNPAAGSEPSRESPAPAGFGELARLAADIFQAPLASIELEDWCESWFSSGVLALSGLPTNPYFADTLATSGVFEVRNTALQRPMAGTADRVLDAAGIGFYAGCALRSTDGEALGTIAIYRTTTEPLSTREREMLAALARQGATLVELQSRMSELDVFGAADRPPTPHGARPAPRSGPTPVPTDSLLDHTPVAIYYGDTQSDSTYVNPEYRRMFRLEPTQDVNDWPQVLHPDDRARIEARWSEFMRSPDDIRLEYRAIAVGGAVRYFSEHAVPTAGSSGFVGTISDITDLVETRTLLEAVIGALPVALVACDIEGRITHYNRATVELYCGEPEHLKRPMAQVFLMDGVTAVRGEEMPLARALRGETITNLELIVVPHGATPRSTLASVRRLMGPDGQMLGAVAVIQDTTERKRAERELERVHRELLTASREAGMAEVATNVLHNVGNILNSINISADVVTQRVKGSGAAGVSRLAALMSEHASGPERFLLDDPRGRRVPEYLAALGAQLAMDQREMLAELALLRGHLEHIKDTVMMQQSYAKLCGVAETVEVAALVEDSLRLHADVFQRKGVQLEREFAPVPSISVDKHKVLRILVNLIRNAQEACGQSENPNKRIILRVGPSPRGVRISVLDNGVGILPANLPNLFRHGFTTREAGHGFGLHSAALAAKELGGTLHAESAGSGQGARFILDLPVAPSPAAVA